MFLLDETSLNQQAEIYFYSTLFILPKAKKIILTACYLSKQVNFQQKIPLKTNLLSSQEISASFTENTSVISDSGCWSFWKRFLLQFYALSTWHTAAQGFDLNSFSILGAFQGPTRIVFFKNPIVSPMLRAFLIQVENNSEITKLLRSACQFKFPKSCLNTQILLKTWHSSMERMSHFHHRELSVFSDCTKLLLKNTLDSSILSNSISKICLFIIWGF